MEGATHYIAVYKLEDFNITSRPWPLFLFKTHVRNRQKQGCTLVAVFFIKLRKRKK
jgi:hypothetical protein